PNAFASQVVHLNGRRQNVSKHSDFTDQAPGGSGIVRTRAPRSVDALAVGLAVVLTLLAGGAAYASFTAGGAGSGSAPTGTMQPVVISALVGGDDPSSTLVPGGTADVIVRVTNPNPAPVQVFGVAANGAVSADLAHAACTTTGVTFTPPDAPIVPTVTVLASSSLLIHLPGAVTMSLASLPECQGATFEIPVTVTARQ
ncbi:MAG: hypothetical protein WD178_05825, partial [Actinomycetota bacterium]